MDCGDFGDTKGQSQTLKVEYLLKGMSLLKYDAINLAERDLQYGTKFFEKMQATYHLPFVSANVYYSGSDKLFAKPYIIKKIGDVRFGIFGVTLIQGYENMITPETGFTVKDPIVAARSVVADLRKQCDVVIALAHLGLYGASDLAKNVAGIDFIIGGHHGSQTHSPQQIGTTYFMQAGSQGKYLGQFEFVVSSNSIGSVQGKTVALSEKIPDDQTLAKLAKEYDDVVLQTFPLESQKAIMKFSSMSERSCVSCHLKQHMQWRTTLHYHAWQTLVDKKQNHNPECQKCHTTLFDEPNGFTKVGDTPDLVNVQCVECHRPVGDVAVHISRFRKKAGATAAETNGQAAGDFQPVSEQTCLKCHTPENSPKFKYEIFLTKVTH